jgi:2-methylcitrate dehydratase PrpD
MSVTRELAEFVAQTSTLPDPIKAAAADVILDSIGCALAAVPTDLGLMAQRFASIGGATGEETILGTSLRAPPPLAAYTNGRLINIIDQDETYMVLGHHANAALGAALALAAHAELDGATLARAFAIGFEVGTRVGHHFGSPLAVGADGKTAGWHFPGSVIGVFAACAASSVCLGLSVDQVENAFGISAQYMPTNGGELWEAGRRLAGLPTAKYEDCGLNAQAGLMAALMAREGMTGTLQVFDKGSVLPSLVHPGAISDGERLLDGLGRDWRLTRTSFKPWPSCRWFHYVLTALHFILSKETIDPATIERIELHSSGASCHFSDPEIGSNIVMDASFSLPHSAAMMVLGVPAGPAWFDPSTVRRTDVAALRRKVTVTLEPKTKDPTAWGDAANWGKAGAPMKVPSRAVIHAGGRKFEAASEHALGDPWSDAVRFTPDDVARKFGVLAGSLAPQYDAWQRHVGKLVPHIRNLDAVASVSDLLAELSPLTFTAGAA